MVNIPDAPWIRETEATGYCSCGWWNTPPKDDDNMDDRDDRAYREYREYDEESDFGGEDDVFYGNETRYF